MTLPHLQPVTAAEIDDLLEAPPSAIEKLPIALAEAVAHRNPGLTTFLFHRGTVFAAQAGNAGLTIIHAARGIADRN